MTFRSLFLFSYWGEATTTIYFFNSQQRHPPRASLEILVSVVCILVVFIGIWILRYTAYTCSTYTRTSNVRSSPAVMHQVVLPQPVLVPVRVPVFGGGAGLELFGFRISGGSKGEGSG